MIGMNALTGRTLSGLAHVHQSIATILTTPLGSRLMRREFGSDLPNGIDAPNQGITRTWLYAAMATALMRWEPRLQVTRLQWRHKDRVAGRQIVEIEGVTAETHDPITTRLSLTRGGAR